MHTYETAEMNFEAAHKFMILFDSKIGTDRELNKVDDNRYYLVCFELEGDEIEICREIEVKCKTIWS